jgi:hypothetical protein
MLYVGRVYLKYADKEFWSLTPRQYYSQLSVHSDLQSKNPNGAEQEGTIDQVAGW